MVGTVQTVKAVKSGPKVHGQKAEGPLGLQPGRDETLRRNEEGGWPGGLEGDREGGEPALPIPLPPPPPFIGGGEGGGRFRAGVGPRTAGAGARGCVPGKATPRREKLDGRARAAK